ncbi:MAG TPA: hypothetical protein PK103_03705 [Elusimicrobiales bacterium]|nr:hypothetical protein [Elusimicrobiales bacterium]
MFISISRIGVNKGPNTLKEIYFSFGIDIKNPLKVNLIFFFFKNFLYSALNSRLKLELFLNSG